MVVLIMLKDGVLITQQDGDFYQTERWRFYHDGRWRFLGRILAASPTSYRFWIWSSTNRLGKLNIIYIISTLDLYLLIMYNK